MKDNNKKEIFSNIYNRISLACSKNSGIIQLINNQSILDFTSFIMGYKNHNEFKQINKKAKNNSVYNNIDISNEIESLKSKISISIPSLEKHQVSCKHNKHKDYKGGAKPEIVPIIIGLGYEIKNIMKSYERIFINATQIKILTDNINHIEVNKIIEEIENTNNKTFELSNDESYNKVDFLSFIYNKNLLEDFFYDENDQFSHIFLHIVDQNYIQKDEHPNIFELISFCKIEYLLSCLFSKKSTNLLKNIIKKYLIKNINLNVAFDDSNQVLLNEDTILKHEKNIKTTLSKLVAIKNLYENKSFIENGFFIDNTNLKNNKIYTSNSTEIEDEIFSYLINKTLENKIFENSYLINRSNIQLNSINKHHIEVSSKISDYEEYTDVIILDKNFNFLHNQFIVDFHINTKHIKPIFNHDYKWVDGQYFYMKKLLDNLDQKYELKTVYSEKPQK